MAIQYDMTGYEPIIGLLGLENGTPCVFAHTYEVLADFIKHNSAYDGLEVIPCTCWKQVYDPDAPDDNLSERESILYVLETDIGNWYVESTTEDSFTEAVTLSRVHKC